MSFYYNKPLIEVLKCHYVSLIIRHVLNADWQVMKLSIKKDKWRPKLDTQRIKVATVQLITQYRSGTLWSVYVLMGSILNDWKL